MLKIYNNLTQKKEEFVPINPGKVGLYVCGLTVYDYAHVGHARIFVTFDMVTRYLQAKGFDVTYVRNITDIDDKIIRRAQENHEGYTAITERFIKAMHEDEASLGVLSPTYAPKATEHMSQIIDMVKVLVDKDYAYQAENGDVYYDVTKFSKYGELAHQDLDELQAGARIAVTDAKRSPLDFVLWKAAKPGEPSWESPWGPGRPGWHIECSAMATEYLGKHFDIHGGGADLQFPHHQNEIAQAEAAHDCTFVNTWMHVGHIRVNQEKMSKSLGNFFTLRDVLKQYSAEVLRYFMLSSHYRSPVNYSQENLNNAKSALERFYLALRGLEIADNIDTNSAYHLRFYAAMDDDFNTPEALAVLFDLARDINKLRDQGLLEEAGKLAAILKSLASLFGIVQLDPKVFLQSGLNQDQTAKIEALISARNQARKDKNWDEADRVRDELQTMNVELEDTANGTVWRLK